MNNEAFELCKQVYERLGWKGTKDGWYETIQQNNDIVTDSLTMKGNKIKEFICPDYDCEYLLEKLPAQCSVNRMYTEGSEAVYMQKKPWIRVTGLTPKLVLLKLVIALADQNILKKENE